MGEEGEVELELTFAPFFRRPPSLLLPLLQLIYYLNSLFARPSNFVSTSPPNSSSNANIVPSPVQAQHQLPSPNGSSPRQPSPHQASTSTTGSLTGTAPPGPPIWRASLLHSAMIPGQAGAWQYELVGSPWKCSPKDELASVRLSIALVQTLGRFGWSLGAGVNAGRKRVSLFSSYSIS